MYKSDKIIKRIKKYKFENFIINILAENINSQDELDKLEVHYIKFYDSIKNGYNIREGGSKGKLNKETIMKMKKAHKNQIPTKFCRQRASITNKGKIISEEHKKILRECRLGTKLNNKIKEKISNSLKHTWKMKSKKYKKDFGEKVSSRQTGRKFSEQRKKAISESRKGQPAKNRIKVCINGTIYESMTAASKKLNIPIMTIWLRIKNKYNGYYKVH